LKIGGTPSACSFKQLQNVKSFGKLLFYNKKTERSDSINYQLSILIMARKTKKNVRSTRIVIIWFIIMAVFIAELLIYTWSRVQCIKSGYEISNENKKNRNLINLQNNLKVELARLKSPERLAKIAKNQLGLKTPTPEQIIIIP